MNEQFDSVPVDLPEVEPVQPPIEPVPPSPKKRGKKWIVALILAGIVAAGLFATALAGAGVGYFLYSQITGDQYFWEEDLTKVKVVETAVPENTATVTVPGNVTVSKNQSVWDIAETMLSECAGAKPFEPKQHPSEYDYEMEINNAGFRLDDSKYYSGDFDVYTWDQVLLNDGVQDSPFGFADPNNTELIFEFDPRYCEGYVLLIQNIPENSDADGILAGEAYLFYEVGGVEPYVLDGQLKEVHFYFSPSQ